MRASEPCESQCEAMRVTRARVRAKVRVMRATVRAMRVTVLTLNKEYYFLTASNSVQITVQIFSDIVQFFVQ